MALSGDSSQTKNSLRRDTIDVTYISGLSSINFEKLLVNVSLNQLIKLN